MGAMADMRRILAPVAACYGLRLSFIDFQEERNGTTVAVQLRDEADELRNISFGIDRADLQRHDRPLEAIAAKLDEALARRLPRLLANTRDTANAPQYPVPIESRRH